MEAWRALLADEELRESFLRVGAEEIRARFVANCKETASGGLGGEREEAEVHGRD